MTNHRPYTQTYRTDPAADDHDWMAFSWQTLQITRKQTKSIRCKERVMKSNKMKLVNIFNRTTLRCTRSVSQIQFLNAVAIHLSQMAVTIDTIVQYFLSEFNMKFTMLCHHTHRTKWNGMRERVWTMADWITGSSGDEFLRTTIFIACIIEIKTSKLSFYLRNSIRSCFLLEIPMYIKSWSNAAGKLSLFTKC